MEKNLLGVKFKDNLYTRKLPKEYFLKKINIEDYPKLKKNLISFFNDSNKYFQTTYDDKRLIIGKKYSKNRKDSLYNSYSDSIDSKRKTKSKKLLKRMTLKKHFSLKASIDKAAEEKKKNYTAFEENALKQGQKFIDDKEVETLFNLYKEARKINKNRINKFITVKELKEIDNNKIYDFRRTSRNFGKNNFTSLKSYHSIKNKSDIDNKKKKDIKKNEDNSVSNKDIIIAKDSSNNDIDYYRTSSTRFTGSFMDELNIKNNFVETDFTETNNYFKLKNGISKEIKDRNKLIKKQTQYIPKDLDKTSNIKLRNLYSLQENTFLCQNKNRNYKYHLNKYLSSKMKLENNKHLLIDDENYRPNLEIKLKLSNLQKKLNPDKLYNWYNDLHCSENFYKTYSHLPIVETIRNPKYIKNYFTPKNKFLEKNEYLEKIFPKQSLQKIIKDYKNAQTNFDSLCVKGVNLLKFENDLFKKLKGRKIINDFERLMSPSSLKDQKIYSKYDKKIYKEKNRNICQMTDSA